jgi:aminoglycoside phosphotransferase (APT) family kinase protein
MISEATLTPLLKHLASASPAAGAYGPWRYAPIGGGANNLVYRATSPDHDLAIKWTIRDARDRAGREYHALAALRDAGLTIAPEPILLDRDHYLQPVMVATWLAGQAHAGPPDGAAEWQALLDHYLAIHTLTPEHTTRPILPAVVNMRSAADGLALIEQQLTHIPTTAGPAELSRLARTCARRAWPGWPAPALALCRVDANIRNIVRQPAGWASVDWENSGWGDPAFEIAELICHPAYEQVAAQRWEWLIEAYAEARGEPAAAARIRVYHPLMLVWWVARLARTLYEVPRGGDARLVARPDGWAADMQARLGRYVERARIALG